LLVEAFAQRVTAQLLDQLGIGAAVGGAHPPIHACGRALANQVMGTSRAGVYLQRQNLPLPPGQVLDLPHETGADPVADEVGESLLFI
jgi:hypothetical protein